MNPRYLAKLLDNKAEDMLEVLACLVVYFISGQREFNLWAAEIQSIYIYIYMLLH